jgi:large subunit ribosomal protein L5
MAESKSKQAQSQQAQARASQAKAAQAQQARADRERRPARQGEPPSGPSGARTAVLDSTPPPPPRLKERYAAEIAPALREEFGYANVMMIPGLSKIVVNMGVGEAARDAKLIDGAVRDLTIITGQKPAVARARKSVAQFKLREGMPIGAHVTLRGTRMWEFCDRLLSLALPRIRDFRGLNDKQFDGRGNYTFGLTEQLMFHEIDPDQVDRQRGMDVTVVTTATNDDEGRSLLRRLGFPFRES